MCQNQEMRLSRTLILLSLPFASVLASSADAELRPEKVHVADIKKTQTYVRDGLITGGDKAINEFVVKDIRRATNTGYERVVIDLEGNRNGEPAAIERAPYYQVAVTPDEKRMVVTVFGRSRLGFDSKRIQGVFKKSAVVEKLVLLPTLEDGSWTFAFEMKGSHPVEVFELSNPVRVIVDIRNR